MSGDEQSVVNLPNVEIHATDVCNNRCTFCTTGWLMLEKGEEQAYPPRELIRAQLEEAFRKGARRAVFAGGEPTTRRDLGELLADARDIGYLATTVFTNGRMAASKAGAQWMTSMNVTWFQVSIQGGTAAAHDASVGAKGAFEQTVAGTRRLLENRQRVKVNGVLTVHLLETLREFAELMVDLRPEEVGLDTVKPLGAFNDGRESFEALSPPLSRYAGALRDAVLRLNEAGITARLTSFPPCLVPGAEHLVAEEADTTQSAPQRGNLFLKTVWKRAMQVKPPSCRACAYDRECGGVYQAYADLHGFGELRPLRERGSREPEERPRPGPDSPITLALRAALVSSRPGASSGVREVRRLVPGEVHELVCFGPAGESTVLLSPRTDEPAYAHTARFSVRYQAGPSGGRPDERLLAAVVQWLKRAEGRLPAPR